MVKLWGYHDAYASGVVHAIAGGAALSFLIVLGPRIGKFRAHGTPRYIPPHNVWLVTIGLFLIYTGFWEFYAACNIPLISPATIAGQITGETWTATTIYLTPTTLSAITFNFLMSLSGGMLAGYLISKGDPFWTFSCGLCGIIGASVGNDLYHPIQAMLIGAIVPTIAYKLHYFVEHRFKNPTMRSALSPCTAMADSSVWSLPASCCGGTPSSPYEGFANVNPLGNFAGACVMFLLGFIPIFIVCKILDSFGMLRVPPKVELERLDFAQNQAFLASVREVGDAERAMVK